MSGKRYLRTEYDLGEERIIVKTYSAGMLGNHASRKPKETATSEKVKRHNRKKAVFNLMLLLKLNFIKGDWNITLTYQKGLRPTKENAKKIVQKFFRDLRRWCERNGRTARYIWVTHIGKKGGIHHHVILNQGIPFDVICDLWKYGAVSVGHPLYPDKDYRQLAAYLLDDTKNGDCPSAHEKGERLYNASRNLKRAEPKRKWINTGKWKKNPKEPKGWSLDKDSLINGVDLFGFPYQFYIIRKNTERRDKHGRSLSDKGAGHGSIQT